MNNLALILFWLLIGLAVAQGLLVLRFVLALVQFKRPLIDDADAPKAAVILALRGGDPFLADCIGGLLAQDYPRFEIHVVVDHPDDPANAILDSIVSDRADNQITIHFLDPTADTCSLKCSSVVQAVEALDESFEFMAQIDADTVPHRTWLRELATALSDKRVGAATGNRWYMPNQATMGSMVRYVWNAAAVVQMHTYQIAWGGTLAVKTDLLRNTNLLEKWSSAFCEDTMLFTFLKTQGLRIAFVPSLMMVNRESCDIGGFYHWVRRQLLTAKLYHPAWYAVVGHGVITTVAPALAIALLIAALVTGDTTAALWTIAALGVYQVAVTLALLPMEHAVRRIAGARGEPTEWMTIKATLGYVLAVPLTQLVYAAALGSTLGLRTVAWRGIDYEIGGPWDVKRGEYRPYQPQSRDSATSL